MKMKRDDLMMVILTVIVVLGGMFYYVATQIKTDTSHSAGTETVSTTELTDETVATTEPTDGTTVSTEPTDGSAMGGTSDSGEKSGEKTSANAPTIHVILNSLDRVIGGTLNGLWVDASTTGHYLKGGEVYKYYFDGECVGERASTVFDPEQDYNEIDNTYWIQMQEGPEPIAEFTFAMTGNWDPFIRKAQPVSQTERFKPAVQRLLEERSMLNSDIVIREAYKIDVEGDGTPEYVIVASNCTETDADNITNEVEFSREDKYSFIILEKAGKHILLLERTKGIYDVTVTCADLDGDKKIEFLIHAENYESLIAESYTTGFYTIMKLNGNTAVEVTAITSTPQ